MTLDPRQFADCTNFNGIYVMVSKAKMRNGGAWLHVSCSRPDQLPSWNDLKAVKDKFIGCEKLAVQVLPASKDYVNLHPYCLHLFSPLSSFTVGLPNLQDIESESKP